MARARKLESRTCPDCGYDVGSGNMGSHKRGPICSNRRSRLNNGEVPLRADWVMVSLLKETGLFGWNKPAGEIAKVGDDHFVKAWVARALDFYRARAETYIKQMISRGEKTCEADMVKAALAAMGE